MALCAFLFFTPGLSLGWLGLDTALPNWLTQSVAWGLLALVYLGHRARQRRLPGEVAA